MSEFSVAWGKKNMMIILNMMKHDDHIKTLTHSLQKYKTDVDCDDTLKKKRLGS